MALPPALARRDPFGTLLVTGYAIVLGLQTFIVVGGVTKLIPHTGLTTPFLSAGGSFLLAHWIILGVLLGGQLVGPPLSPLLRALDLPFVDLGLTTPPEAAISAIVFIYMLAAGFNLYIPRTEAPLQRMNGNLWWLVRDFSHCNARLWNDKLGQISLATTTLFWGVAGNLRYIVLAWAAAALGYSTTQASSLVGVVAIGTAVGAVLALSLIHISEPTRPY